MVETPAMRRMRLLEILGGERDGVEWRGLAALLGADERTIRRDVDSLQGLFGVVHGIEVRRGRIFAARGGYGPGYFAGQVEQQRSQKESIARAIVASLNDNSAVALTAGSTTYFVANAIRRAAIENERPRGLIAFTNSLPALHELIAGGISTGIIGDVYDPDDAAFHSHELRTAFHPEVAIVGASGVVANRAAGTLDLFSHRAEEAAFMKQLLALVPRIIVAADSTKIGRRHPWSFTDTGILADKNVELFTHGLSDEQRDSLESLAETAQSAGYRFSFTDQQGE